MQSPNFQRIHPNAVVLLQSPSTHQEHQRVEVRKLMQWTDEPALAIFWFVYFVAIAYTACLWLQVG